MKVGILTFPNSPSFGASLQMRGLYRALEMLGADVEIINYQNTYMRDKKHINVSDRNAIRNAIIELLTIPGKIKFHNFEKHLRFFPSKIINENDNFEQINNRYDYLICGSDQVWNPLVTGEDTNYFFSFCDSDAKKISYAASFGVDKLSGTFADNAKELLAKFNHISVREERGVEIISELLDRNCTLVVDPTMLISQSEWRSHEKKISSLPPRYIAKFIFNYDKNVEEKIDELSKKTDLPVVTIGGTFITKLKNKLVTGSIGPNEWLYVLDHADYVVTDSFHGAAFSIILHKNLWVSLASSTNSRLKTLIHTFGLDNRVITDGLKDCDIDYNNVQKIMDEKRAYSLDFLKKAINIGS